MHALLVNLRAIADATDPAHLAKLKAEMEATGVAFEAARKNADAAKLKVDDAYHQNLVSLSRYNASLEALKSTQEALKSAEAKRANALAEREVAIKAAGVAAGTYHKALAASK